MAKIGSGGELRATDVFKYTVYSCTTDDEVGVEDSQCCLVGVLLVVDGSRDDQAKGDPCYPLQHNQSYHQRYGAFIGNL